MTIDWENDYMPLKEVAELTKTAYTTLHNWAIADKLPGAIFRNGTRWYVHMKTVRRIQDGELEIKGAFGKRD
jgi:predicted site-specific integrase-resolvase